MNDLKCILDGIEWMDERMDGCRAANKYFILTGHMSDQFTILVGLYLNLVGHKTIITTISGT